MKWIYLSPHFDDAVLSCGGLIWEQIQAGNQVEVWTVCAGGPHAELPLSQYARNLHECWQTGPETVNDRRLENISAIAELGALCCDWDLPDCIYRRLPDGTFVVNSNDDLWLPVRLQENRVITRLRGWLEARLIPEDRLVCPMSVGNHMDHRLTRAAAEAMDRTLWYYADFPYVATDPASLTAFLQPTWSNECFCISIQGVEAWQRAIAKYSSQVSTFWNGLAAMRADMELYWRSGGGSCLWRRT